ncbi:MAG TPA: CoA-acylating methylmalonate-semialdehyde dehydrogenase [Baekduia sp.]|nr:CoA-acylating methylmalonate-semialdehyde dehydrogenase [Baekduia sp.]
MSATQIEQQALHHWIAGRRDGGSGGRSGLVLDPATGEVTASVPFASPEDVDRAVAAAAEAAEPWAATSPVRRARVLQQFLALMRASTDAMAARITSEHGKTLDDARGEIQRGIEVVEFACGIPHLLKGQFADNVGTGVDSYSMRQPLGVVAGITPFNFPAMVPMWMYPIALACGNAFILKPSERIPSASLLAAELLEEAGLPAGVFSVVNGDRETVEQILDHKGIAAVSFVGSTPVARAIYERGTASGKRVQALGGAKNHAVVLPDADLEATADAIVSAAYGSAGQRCMAISVAVAVGDSGDGLVSAVIERARGLKVGPGSAPGTDVGPLITGASRDRVEHAIEDAIEDGAKVVLDGRREDESGGFFVGPTVIDDVKPGMDAYDVELFGPVLAVVRVDSFDEALELIATNPYGNGAAIFTRDGGAARAFEQRVQAGMVGVNVPIPVPSAIFSFGGWKESLFGDIHIHGPEGVSFYTRGKVITTRWPVPSDRDGVQLGFPVHHE